MKNFSPLSRIRPSPTSLVSVRCYSQNNDGDNNSGSSNSCNSNKSLNLSFQGLIPKLLALEKVLLSNNGRREYIDLQMRGIFISTFQGLVLYSHLQNPLLKKYTFDVADFFAGARESVKLILELSGSTDFVEYAIGKPISSVPESVKFIKQVLLNEDGNEPFKELLIGTRKFALFRSFCASGTVLPWMRIQEIKKLKIVQMVIDSISTRVVEKVEEEENDQQVKETKDKKIRVIYPEGSVVASVHVFYETVESHPIDTSPEWWKIPSSSPSSFSSSSSSQSPSSAALPDWPRSRVVYVTFEGCISGHMPLDWKIATMTCHDKNFLFEILFKRLPDLE